MKRSKSGGLESISAENYVKTIFLLQEQLAADERVKSKAIAEALEIAQPSVTSMLKNLAQAGFIEYLPYQGVRTTDVGRLLALRIIRKHRLVEVFLIETLGLSWDEVHEEAEQLEHAISDKVADRLDQFLGFPSFDPHGDPIPDREGRLPEVDAVPLATVSPPAQVCVARVIDQTPEFLRYLSAQGLVPGTVLTLQHVEPFEGPLEVALGDSSMHISRSLARRVWVTLVG